MRRFALTMLAAAGIALVSTEAAQAGCRGWRCINRQVTALRNQVNGLRSQLSGLSSALVAADARIASDETTINDDNQQLQTLFGCLAEAPLTQYGDPLGTFGYVFNPGGGGSAFNTTALDVTISGGAVGGWALFDGCNTAKTAAPVAGSGRMAPALPLSSLQRPQARQHPHR
jgi:hypothetical protein